MSALTERNHVHFLSQLVFQPEQAKDIAERLASASPEEREEFLHLALANHVLIRAFEPLREAAEKNGITVIAEWASKALEAERADTANALKYLDSITRELEAAGCPTTVIKSLDHTPDMGNDLDMYTTSGERPVIDVMVKKFNAHVEDRSWGDRLAGKWNFVIPGLKKTVEMHTKRLGQTGEHTDLARRFVTRRVQKTVNGYTFYVPAAEERMIAATLQRMYRHFYFRLCDIVNTVNMVENGELDFAELKRATRPAGIWPGCATFLKIVSDYVKQYRGHGLELPQEVLSAAVFGGNKLGVKKQFLRLPIVPESAQLYTLQMVTTTAKRDFPATLRLSLLPPLAAAAKIAVTVVGSEKAVW